MNAPFNINFPLSSLPHLIFFVTALAAGVVSVILFFHWRKYGMGGKAIALAEVSYLAVSAALLLTAFFSIN